MAPEAPADAMPATAPTTPEGCVRAPLGAPPSKLIDLEEEQLSGEPEEDEELDSVGDLPADLGKLRLEMAENSVACGRRQQQQQQQQRPEGEEEEGGSACLTAGTPAPHNPQQQQQQGQQDKIEGGSPASSSSPSGEELLGNAAAVEALRTALQRVPLIVFINPHSGGRRGERVYECLARRLGKGQVFNIKKVSPADVFTAIWTKLQGDPVLERLRVMAAGGDGTVTWVLGTLMALGLSPQPAVGILPLGTGNNMAICLGWGDRFRVAWVDSDANWAKLGRHIAGAPETLLDCWEATLADECGDGAALARLPHVLKHAPACGTPGGGKQAKGLFYEFLSVGVTGELAHRFNSLRERRPELFRNRLGNQMWYMLKTLQAGLFLPAAGDQGRYLASHLEVRVAGADGVLAPLQLPARMRGLIILNTQVFAHADMWGTFDFGGRAALDKKYEGAGHVRPSFNDGLVEMVGVFDGWTELLSQVLPSQSAARLAQASEVAIDIVAPPQKQGGCTAAPPRKAAAYLSMDGEPWEQPVPDRAGGGKLALTMRRVGQNRVLFNRTVQRAMPAWVRQVAEANADAVLEGGG